MSTPSPRTTEYPMAFTEQEFMRGALWAWGTFLMLLPFTLSATLVRVSADPADTVGGFVFSLLIGVCALFVAAPISLVIMALGAWPFRLVGRAMQGVRSFTVHLLMYCVLGAAAGIGAGFIADAFLTVIGGAAIGIATGAAIPLGWAITARRALRDDRRPASSTKDQDAVFEDRALDA